MRGEHVVEVLNRLVAMQGAPKTVFVDNGSKVPSTALVLGAMTGFAFARMAAILPTPKVVIL